MNVYHPKVGVFDPYGMYDGDNFICDLADGTEKEVPVELAEMFYDEKLLSAKTDRFQVFSGKASTETRCPQCKGNVFHVGGNKYWETYVKCVKCGVEFCVHQG